jgi:short-subunit dehydrogenase
MMKGKTVLITGASSGIGYAAALAFARRGANVVGTARRVERLQALADAVNALPQPHGEILTLSADVQKADAMEEAVAQTINRFGRLDVLVANAGLGLRGAVVESKWEDIETLLRTNIDGVIHSIRAAVPAMRRTGGGHIVIISSVSYRLTTPYAALYAASKAFVSSMADALRYELAADHIGVVDLIIGRTQTEFNESRLGATGRSKDSGGIPEMSAEHVGEAIVKAVETNKQRTTVRLFDTLLMAFNRVFPGYVARRAAKQYKA